MKLKNQVSKLIGLDVESHGWDEAFRYAKQTGTLTDNIPDILLEICKYLDPYSPDIMAKPTSVNEPMHVFNPLTKDFNVQFDLMGNGSPMTFTAKSQEITKFDPKVAVHVKKYLINEILAQRNINYPTTEDIQKVDGEISINPQL